MSDDDYRVRPIEHPERIVAIDVLRGFALLGILLANINGFATDPEQNQTIGFVDKVFKFGVDTFVRGKFIILFSALFGISFALLISRLREKSTRPGRIFARRQLGLLIIGILHVLLFSEQDILVFYAILGCGLWAFYDVRKRYIIVFAITFYIISFVPPTLDRMQIVLNTESTHSGEIVSTPTNGLQQHTKSERHPYETSDLLAIAHHRVVNFLQSSATTHYQEYLRKFPFFLLGLYMVKAGWLRGLDGRLRPLPQLVVGFGVIGVISQYLLYLTYLDTAADWALLVRLPLIAIANPSLSLCYAAIVVLAYNHSRLKQLVALLAYAGRAALSNYVLQSVICTTIFYGYGFGLFNQFSYLQQLLIAGTIFFTLVPVSAWWLTRFRFGPLEWIWRRFTYRSNLRFATNR